MKRRHRHSPTTSAVDDSVTTALDAVAVLFVLALAVVGLAFA